MEKQTRKALDCKLIGQSDIDPKYFKYEVTIQEANGDRKEVFKKVMKNTRIVLLYFWGLLAPKKYAFPTPFKLCLVVCSLEWFTKCALTRGDFLREQENDSQLLNS